jgi:hypothetical protein
MESARVRPGRVCGIAFRSVLSEASTVIAKTLDVLADCFAYRPDGALLPAPITGQIRWNGMAPRNHKETAPCAQIDVVHESPQMHTTIDRVVISLVAWKQHWITKAAAF